MTEWVLRFVPFLLTVPSTLKRYDPNKAATSNSPKCEWPYIINNDECDFIIMVQPYSGSESVLSL